MNIEGLDYNTQREQLIQPEYGREVQKMVEYAVSLNDKEERQLCAKTIISIMERMFPQSKENADYKQKLWDHLAIMSDFKLDIDYPVDISKAKSMEQKPQPIGYSKEKNPVKHYGSLVFQLFERLKTMPAGKERDALTKLTANQMKRNLIQWSHGSNDDEKIISDLARFTDGIIQLDLDKFKFDVSVAKEPVDKKKKKR
ncbi:MAG: DUF4290 domain-containing protein [Prevotella sp.]|nr:DUF4290 domain-containing protein [Paraprevotella sp.]MCI6201054.1 DUF4290 domain-containing protein [Paraprevotella sp.]MDD5856369.1 DUF4290 domain-containing protein [Prevotella sp.]MDD7692365.1 DUF4290 domain-containing protein [Prevotella sp.]MDY4409075.1 DUF4290 domain-containing protein [Prevotella sp.]